MSDEPRDDEHDWEEELHGAADPEDASSAAEDRASDDPLDPDAGLETGETPGLGLTEEFARIEAEIEDDARHADESESHSGAERDAQPGEPGEADPEEPTPADATTGRIDEPLPADVDDSGDAELAPGDSEAFDEVEAASDEIEAPAADPGTGEWAASDEIEAPAADPGTEEWVSAGVDDGADDGSGELTDGEAEAPAAPDGTAVEHPVVRPMPRKPMPVAAAPVIPDEELEAKTPKLWLRFLAGSVLIIVSMAAAVSVTGLLFLSDVAAKLQPIPGIGEQLETVDPGAPQTILIIGSDRRAGTDKSDRRSDTTMLLRVDPDQAVLSLFSLPRDLKVDIPGVGVAKLNEAYTAGGEKKTLKTVKAFTGLEINHVVEINFSGFADAVNAIDCVYIDVDREYFNDNSTVAAGTTDGYAEIDINAGYQRLCGLKALQYVRYRHTDTDLVRAARQQDFLREARQKVEPRELLGAIFGSGTGNELINIFTEYTRSDIDDEDDVIGILKSFASIRDVPVNEVHFEGDIGGPDDPFVTSTDKQVEKAIDEFLNGVGSDGQRGGEKANKKKAGGNKSKDKKEKKTKDQLKDAAVVSTDSLSDSKFPTLAERFETDANKNARRLGIPVFYPTVVVPGSSFGTDSRTYEYENEDNKKESAYKTVIPLSTPSTLLEYYGVMGTTWSDPPILRNPSETRKIAGREYDLFYDGGRLRLVGWSEKGNSYWLSNTLTQSIGEAEMLAVATSMREV